MAVSSIADKGSTTRSSDSRIWNNPTVRGVFWQIALIVAVVGSIYYLAHNAFENLERQHIASGFGFLDREAGFDISEKLVQYEPSDTYRDAFVVGLLNTFEVAGLGVVLATILGTLIGIARLSKNWLLSRMAQTYVELWRNLPLLLQLFFWYALLHVTAPGPRDAWHPLPGVFISNRGLMFPTPEANPTHKFMWIAFFVGIIATIALDWWGRKRQETTGKPFPIVGAGLGLIIGLPLIVFLATGAHMKLDLPSLQGFNFAGGASFSPELTALLIGLVVYTASYIAEIVRSGILAVNLGQSEAAGALGLRGGLILRLIVLPQALRIIIPPMTSQYLNLTKNSTLAVAIGFPDLVFVANTQMNQTGQAIEGIGIIMATYLAISLSISLLMNIYNARIALKGR
ncbi:MAG TPA: amino acid ABC transporter permease [Aliidongia sp.]|uniref:amino acid ABC transporter permease n=1 Tax=Aliidongia sp. TaxID=1914230 RepID=UPI002DDCD024|nr:amino acid ABC transporter permease [Aliidongia sp.]HEV2678091.1 amino acid ABC transporter permease [Aliidongia sp.]